MNILSVGLLSLAQTCLIPGLIISKMFNYKPSFRILLPSAFALSLIFNWVLACYSEKFGLFEPNFIYPIISIELFILGVLYLKEDKPETAPSIKLYSNFEINIRSLSLLVVLLAFFIAAINVGHVFTDNDSVLSWNRWATVWASNKSPIDTYHYPQLLPTNYAISYVLLGSTYVQIFAFAITVLFLPLACLAIFSTAEKISDASLHIANLFFFSLLISLSSTGCADTPVACMEVFSILLFILGWAENEKSHATKLILLSATIAAGCAVTKQAGIYYSLLNVVGVIYWVFKSHKGLFLRCGLIFCIALIYFIICIPWYVEAQHNINSGVNGSEVQYVTNGIYHGQTYLERLFHAILKWPKFFIVASIALLAIKDKYYRWPVIAGILYLLIWSLFFSYDSRNFSVGIPLLSIGAGSAWISSKLWIPKLNLQFLKNKNKPLHRMYLIASCMILFIAPIVPNQFIFIAQEHAQEEVGGSKYNQALYRAFKQHGQGKVLCSDRLLPFASRMPKDVLIHYEFYNHSETNEIMFSQYLSNSELRYIIVDSKGLSENLKKLINSLLKDGKIKLLENIQMTRKRIDPIYLVNTMNTNEQ